MSAMVSTQTAELGLAADTPLPASTSVFSIHNMDGTSSQHGSLEEHELRELGHHRSAMVSQRNISSLAPTDTGFKAWSFVSYLDTRLPLVCPVIRFIKLAGAFLVEAVVWAFPTSFGVLLNAYMRDYKLASQAGATELLPLIGTFSSGIIYCSGKSSMAIPCVRLRHSTIALSRSHYLPVHTSLPSS